MAQSIKLGSRDLGELEITAINVNWQEVPCLDKYGKDSTYKNLYLEVSPEYLKDIVKFYDNIISGDINEGIASNSQKFYNILGMKYQTEVFKETMSYEDMKSELGWDVFANIPEEYKNVSILMEIL